MSTADPGDPRVGESSPPSSAGSPGDAAEPNAPESVAAAPDVPLLTEPADGVPEPITTEAELASLVERLRTGSGPVAIDAERASGYRYSQRAYLVQLRREGAGTALIDPIALPDLSAVGEALAGAEWILHAASQDLACLAEVGMRPTSLFDTELAGRLLGDERVALGTMVEQHLGVRLEKGHSAADWSTRPLPHDWLVYAALDVELLIPLREVLLGLLAAAGKTEWARQEFDAIRSADPAPPRIDPWRRTSGIHRVRSRRQLAAIRALWEARDQYAAERDVAPGRLLPDSAIIDAARSDPKRPRDLLELPVFGGGRQRRQLDRWFAALESARAVPDDELPPTTGPTRDDIPPAARWRDRNPEAAERLARARVVVADLAEAHTVLAQNLLASDVVRGISWGPPEPLDVANVTASLLALGARPWQAALCAPGLTVALAAGESGEPAVG